MIKKIKNIQKVGESSYSYEDEKGDKYVTHVHLKQVAKIIDTLGVSLQKKSFLTYKNK